MGLCPRDRPNIRALPHPAAGLVRCWGMKPILRTAFSHTGLARTALILPLAALAACGPTDQDQNIAIDNDAATSVETLPPDESASPDKATLNSENAASATVNAAPR